MSTARFLAALLCALPLLAGAQPAVTPATTAAHPAAPVVQQAINAGRSNPEHARRFADEALGLIATRPEPDLEIRARLVLCDYFMERDLARAREALARAAALLPLAKRRGLRAGVQNCEGEVHEAAGDNARALSAYERAVSEAELAADDEMLANALYLRGWLRGVQGEYALALVDLRRSIGLYERGNFPEHSRTAVNGVATIYNRMGDFAQAQVYFEQASKAQLAAGLEREAVVTLYNLGRSHEYQGRWVDAEGSFTHALQLSRRLGYARGEAYAARGMAAVHNARGEWLAALAQLARADALADPLPDARLRAHVGLARGVALRGLARPAESLTALTQALEAFGRVEATADVAATYAALAATHADLGNWRGAFDNQQRLKETTDRLHARQLDQRVLALKVEFDTVARDKENALLLREKAATEAALAQELSASRLKVVVIALAGVLAAVLAVVAWRGRRVSRTMQALAMTDELTGLPNRRAVLARLGSLLAEGSPCAVLIVDIDHFKAINDHHGHPIGDEVLRAVAGTLAAELRGAMSAGRLGGEEFLVLVPRTEIEPAMQLAERLRAAMARIDPARWSVTAPITVSVGVALARPGPGGIADVLRRADEALYAAKAAGRNRVRAGQAALVAV